MRMLRRGCYGNALVDDLYTSQIESEALLCGIRPNQRQKGSRNFEKNLRIDRARSDVRPVNLDHEAMTKIGGLFFGSHATLVTQFGTFDQKSRMSGVLRSIGDCLASTDAPLSRLSAGNRHAATEHRQRAVHPTAGDELHSGRASGASLPVTSDPSLRWAA